MLYKSVFTNRKVVLLPQGITRGKELLTIAEGAKLIRELNQNYDGNSNKKITQNKMFKEQTSAFACTL